ncbi:hypothetical protein KM043_015769 [Ampulex compressa]|nr:hypothetical protein KM043_015769 [Ampulex compressa]
MNFWILPILLSLLALTTVQGASPLAKTPLGSVRGYYKISENGRSYEAYEGIPFALPPVGKLRFKDPQRVPRWSGELMATKLGSPCLQYVEIPKEPNEKVEGSEDCLYLNIYVPAIDKTVKKSLPVIFWIHGGAFQFGTGIDMGPKFLMDRDVVYVTINYRLGPLGFLSTEDEIVPGNMGLKDQSMALRWVSENIESFGGDKNKITLVGLSAGGASVHYHYLSPLSANLFQGGISISGTTLNCWTQMENGLEKAKKISALMGCPTTNTREMIRCLRYRPGRTLVQAVSEFMPWQYLPFSPFGPTVEKGGDAPFIDRLPIEIIKSGSVQDVPWITGVTSEEGLYPAADFITDEEKLHYLEQNWESLAPHLMDFNYTVASEKKSNIAHLIKQHYLGSKKIDKNTVKELVQMIGDRLFVVDSEKAARIQAEVNQKPVWYYRYTYRAAHSLSESMSGSNENFGVSHADDAFMVIDTPFVDGGTTKEDRTMREKLMDLWVSFATNGVPNMGNVEWPKLDSSKKQLNYLHIAAPEKINMETNANLGQKEFWNSIEFAENNLVRNKEKNTEL